MPQMNLRKDILHLYCFFVSVGQVPNDVAALMKVTANVNVDGSVAKKRDHKHRKTTKRQVYDESSSYESSEKARVKDEGSLLRRIIRSEMRKFIRVGNIYIFLF